MQNKLTALGGIVGVLTVCANLWIIAVSISGRAASGDDRLNSQLAEPGAIHDITVKCDELERHLQEWMAPAASAATRTTDREGGDLSDFVGLASRVQALEESACSVVWKRICIWGQAHLGLATPMTPEPTTTSDLVRATKLACLSALAYNNPRSPYFPQAVEALQSELRADNLQPVMQLRALHEINRLGPQERHNGQVTISLGGNITAAGAVRIPDDAVEKLIGTARRFPGLRPSILQGLAGVSNDKLIAYAIEALRDPQRAVRANGVDLIRSLPKGVERDRALDAAIQCESDSAIRSQIESWRKE